MRAAAASPLLPAERLAPLTEDYARVRRAGRHRIAMGGAIVLVLAFVSLRVAEVDPTLLRERGGDVFGYFGRILTLEAGPHAGSLVLRDPAEWFWGWDRWLPLLGDTVLMAYVGTLLGCAGGFALGLLSAANIVPSAPLRWGVKRVLEFCRTVPEVVFALVFVIAFGLGPLPGVLAIAIHSLGAMGKLFSEVVENIDMQPVEGAAAAGASWARMVRFAVVPQVLPGFVGYALLRFEINVRGAAVLGFVGAGGIGQDLVEAVRKFYYNDVAALLVLIVLTVTLIDGGTGWLRRRLLGSAA
jgi:phosphonate transport system permease protein